MKITDLSENIMQFDGVKLYLDAGPNGRPAVFLNPCDVIIAHSPEQVRDCLVKIEHARKNNKFVVGFLSYELGYCFEERLLPLMPENRKVPLLCFGVFDGYENPDIESYVSTGKGNLNNLAATWSEKEYSEKFCVVKEHISSGDFYQANLTFPMDANWRGDPLAIYQQLAKRQPVSYGAYLDFDFGIKILSRSPELFFRVSENRQIETRPMKGTMPRGKTVTEDNENKVFLQTDIKNRAENLMIVDLLRNDISRVSQVGSVCVPDLFNIETYATVHQMTSTIEAVLNPDVTVHELLKALFPCGSITGAPKLMAMEVLRGLEQTPRDIYCGSIGWFGPSDTACFNVAIRTISLFENGDATLNVGGGIVYDSTSKSEYEEALWKARFAAIS